MLEFPDAETLPLAEIEFASHFSTDQRIVTYEAKWEPESSANLDTPPVCPANVEPAVASEIQRVALAAYRLTGCRDYARVDLRVSPDNHVYVLEVNGNPDISPSAGLAKAVKVSGLSYDDFVVRLIEQPTVGENKTPNTKRQERRTRNQEPPNTLHVIQPLRFTSRTKRDRTAGR